MQTLQPPDITSLHLQPAEEMQCSKGGDGASAPQSPDHETSCAVAEDAGGAVANGVVADVKNNGVYSVSGKKKAAAVAFAFSPEARNAADPFDAKMCAAHLRRKVITAKGTPFAKSMVDSINRLNLRVKVVDWLCSLRDLDPRYMILRFFNDLALDGVETFESAGCATRAREEVPALLRGFTKAGIFSVWRPTSLDAIQKMMTNEGVGKGLDIKGKSAKKGMFSGYVPFLQIHDNDHKDMVSPMEEYERVRVFYPNESSRYRAGVALRNRNLRAELEWKASKKGMESSWRYTAEGGGGGGEPPAKEGERNKRSTFARLNMLSTLKDINATLADSRGLLSDDPCVYDIDDYGEEQGVFGLDIPEKLFWETYVEPRDISRPPGSGYETGRPSIPEFQDMNIETLRKWTGESYYSQSRGHIDEDVDPRPVLWHGGCGRVGGDEPEDSDPLCPLGLLMAYEENGRVLPVVSDFDCFLLGTRGVKYHEDLGAQELSMLSSCIEDIEGILSTPREGVNWTQRWLGVKKQHAEESFVEGKAAPEMPKFGYADPRSYKIMTGAVHRLKSNGAVRHGPECFNYGFPQDLDDEFLVVSDTFPGIPWRYANAGKLIEILSEKIDQGFTFPLNPKWILCDKGWKMLYDKLAASDKTNIKTSMGIWYPDKIRKRINEISSEWPDGFQAKRALGDRAYSTGTEVDLAQLELKRYTVRLPLVRASGSRDRLVQSANVDS